MKALALTAAIWAAHNLLPLVLSAVSMFLISIARRYASLLKDEKMRRIATSAITLAEEMANRQQQVTGAIVQPDQKLDTAVNAIMAKVPGIDAVEAAQLVHEELPKVRAALGDFGQATLRAALASPVRTPPQTSPLE